MQNRRGLLFLGLAAMLAIGAAFLAQRWISTQQPEQTVVATAPVVVARGDISVASTLSELQLDVVDWPRDLVPKGAIGSKKEAAGRVLRRPLGGGEPVLQMALFDEGVGGGLGAVISPKHRAVSVKVDSVIGVAGFVKPGSRVDVLATLRRVDQERAIPYAKVILQDVRVLAIDQRLEEARDGQAQQINVVTLEVDPVQAEHLIYAAHEGRLQLALRTPGDDQVVETRSIGVADLLDRRNDKKPAVRQVARPATTAVQVLRGSQMETKTF
jgi:pilus assembly protein CpaB